MPAKNKARGNRLERLIVRRADDARHSAIRSYASNGLALGEDERVDGKIDSLRFQAKMRKQLPKDFRDAQECLDEGIYDLFITKQDRKEPLITMRLDKFFEITEGKYL